MGVATPYNVLGCLAITTAANRTKRVRRMHTCDASRPARWRLTILSTFMLGVCAGLIVLVRIVGPPLVKESQLSRPTNSETTPTSRQKSPTMVQDHIVSYNISPLHGSSSKWSATGI